MKVKELIEKLQKVNPEWTVVYSWEDEELAYKSLFVSEAENLIEGEYYENINSFVNDSLTPNAVVLN
jgi:hypothetical protein